MNETNNVVIYCDVNQVNTNFQNNCIISTSSPLSCFYLAMTVIPSLIIIQFPCAKTDKCSELLKLCRILKKYQNTNKIHIVALINYFQRAIISMLEACNIEYVDFLKNNASIEEKIMETTKNHKKLGSPTQHLSQSCPYLQYANYSEEDEIILCKAHRSRLVINKLRLDSLCSKEKHKNCEYFINPRFSY